MKRHLLAATSLAALVSAGVLFATDTRAAGTTKPFGDEGSIAYADQLWSVLRGVRLVGPDRVRTVPYEGQHPHGAVIETLYDEVSVRGHRGEVIVKRNYTGENLTNSDVAQDRSAHLASVTVMFKRETGYDPANNDWFWVKYTPDGGLHTNPKGMKLAGRVAKGMNAGCIACHKAQQQSDYQFNTTAFID